MDMGRRGGVGGAGAESGGRTPFGRFGEQKARLGSEALGPSPSSLAPKQNRVVRGVEGPHPPAQGSSQGLSQG